MYRVLGISNFYAYINCIYLYEKPNIDSDTTATLYEHNLFFLIILAFTVIIINKK